MAESRDRDSRPMYREDHDLARMREAEATRNGRISTLINQAMKLAHVIDEQVGVLSERLQPITRPMPSEPSEGMTVDADDIEHRDSPISEQINVLIRRLQRLQTRLTDLPERLDV